MDIKTKDELSALTSKGPVVLDFGATWCPPCNKLAPIFSELSQLEEFKGVTFAKVDVEQASELSEEYSITSIPTLIAFKDGNVTATHTGALSKTALHAWISKNTV